MKRVSVVRRGADRNADITGCGASKTPGCGLSRKWRRRGCRHRGIAEEAKPWGAGIGSCGGTAGAIIGNKMDKQAKSWPRLRVHKWRKSTKERPLR